MSQPGAHGSMVSPGSRNGVQHIPAASYIIFSNVPKLEAIRTKLCEFNSMLSASAEKVSLTLGEADVAPSGTLDALLARCDQASLSRVQMIRLATAFTFFYSSCSICCKITSVALTTSA